MVESFPDAPTEDRLNQVFRALSSAPRRRIVQLLRESGELRVGDIAGAFDMSLNGVSKHLKVLESAALISRRVAGKTHWISANVAGLTLAYDWVHAERHFWTSRLDALAALTETPKETP